jgi:hypothetical protein
VAAHLSAVIFVDVAAATCALHVFASVAVIVYAADVLDESVAAAADAVDVAAACDACVVEVVVKASRKAAAVVAAQ